MHGKQRAESIGLRHEIWHYDDENFVQTLIGLIALCPSCHKSKHYGRAINVGDDKFVRKHLKK